MEEEMHFAAVPSRVNLGKKWVQIVGWPEFRRGVEADLLAQKRGLVKYLILKVRTKDWHGVADAAMDIRDIEAKIELLERIEGRIVKD